MQKKIFENYGVRIVGGDDMYFLYRIFSVVVLLLIMQLPIKAQVHHLLLKAPDGEPIGYVSVLCEKRQFHIMSDAYGIVSLDGKRYQPGDSLTFKSIFYQELKIPFGELLKREELILQPVVIRLDDVIVYPTLVVEDLVKEMADFFSKHYTKDYASLVTHLRTIECDGRYREFTGLQGLFFSTNFNQAYNKLFFKDKSSLNWLPITVMRSDPFVVANDKILPDCAIYLPPGSQYELFSKESMKIEYYDYPDQHALVMKRALEIFSPLNPSQLRNFSYSVSHSYERDGDKIYIIYFETKDQAFPKRTRIYGKGMFYYNSTAKLVEKVVMENHQDHYAMFPRWKVSRLLPSATHHTIGVTYTCRNKQIFTKSVKLNVEWVDPQVDKNFFMITLSPRRNPIKHNLIEFENYEFDNFVLLDKSKKRQVTSYLPLIAWDKFYYIAPFDSKAWEKIQWTGINKKRLFRELSLPRRSLLQQAEKNGLDMQFFYGANQEKFCNMVKNLYGRVPQVLRVLYGD
ncbi:MAG: hypothetical protein RR034_03310 [Bacteroidales bacterium]